MVFGVATIVTGYTLFYWGLHHFPNQQRYSLWVLFGLGTLFKNVNMPQGTPVQIRTSTQQGSGGSMPVNPQQPIGGGKVPFG